MEFSKLESEILALEPELQDRLAGILKIQRLKRAETIREVSKKLDDPNTIWVPWDEVKDELYAESQSD